MAPSVLALVVLTALWGFFFWQLLTPTAEDRVIFEKGDFPLHYFSYSDYQVQRLWEGNIPLWNPYNYGGDPFAANVQWAVWYPPRWIAALLAGPHGWKIEALQLEVAAHYWLASLMMYTFLRALVKRPLPALAGSILFTYGGYLTGYPMLQPSILEAVVWLPLLLLGVHLSITHPRWPVRGILLGGTAAALSFLGGHTQTTLQMSYLAAAYLVFVGRQNHLGWKAILGRGVLLAAIGGLLSAVQLLPALELTRLSYRVENYHYADKSVGFAVSELIQLLWPRLFDALWWPLYLGVGGFLLALSAILRPRKETLFWIGVIVVCLWLSMGGHTAVYDFFYLVIPGFSVFREQERAASLVAFALTVLATIQLARLLDGDPIVERCVTWLARGHLALTGSVFAVTVVAFWLSDRPGVPGLLVNTLGFVFLVSLFFNGWLAWRRQDRRPAVWAGLIVLLVVDLFTFGMKSPNFVPDIPQNRVQNPDNLTLLSVPVQDIQWHVDGAAGIQTYGTYFRIPDIYGTGPFSLASMEKLRQIRVDRRWEVLAVRYATMITDVPENVPVKKIGEGVNTEGTPYTLYELLDPRPFAHLVYDVQVFKDDPDRAREWMSGPDVNLRETAATTDPLPFDLPGQRPADSAVNAFRMVMPEYMEMSVTTSTNALLTLAVPNYPGWQATVNGKHVPVIDTYAGLIGVPVGPGSDQKVTLRFLPHTVVIGGLISALTLIGMLGYVIGSVVRDRRISQR